MTHSRRPRLPILVALALAAGYGTPLARAAGPAPAAVTFPAADGVTVHAERYNAGGRRGVVVAFHQAGSNKAEYRPIAPHLAADGFEVIAVDQRSGGPMFGATNQTAAGVGGHPDYAAALPDLAAALAYAKRVAPGRPVVVVGSSYSASLSLVLAAAHPEVAAVAVFSPGEYLPGRSVHAAAARVTCPLFIASAPAAAEVAAGQTFLDAAPAHLKQQYVPTAGVHGASLLRTDRDPDGAEPAWAAFESFFDKAVPPAGK